VRELEARVAELEQSQARLAEIEERLDFNERLLSQQRDAARLGEGNR
jgi:Tfp pilus assembly protein PilO